jgi:hypothetical protein
MARLTVNDPTFSSAQAAADYAARMMDKHAHIECLVLRYDNGAQVEYTREAGVGIVGHGVPVKLMQQPELPETEQAARGAAIVRLLGLHLKPGTADRYDTSVGDKTALGLYRTIKRIIDGGLSP